MANLKIDAATLAQQARAALTYDETAGILYWRWRPELPDRLNKRLAGTPAGAFDELGYERIQFNGRRYKAHRLIWLIVYGAPLPPEIDHINGVKGDNRLSNLRAATPAENRRNRPAPRTNTSGLKGATWHAGKQKWTAQIHINGRLRHLGAFDTREAAHAAYCTAAAEAHGEFARF